MFVSVSALRAAERLFDVCYLNAANSLIFLLSHHDLSDPDVSPPPHSGLVFLLSLSSGLK